MRQPIDAEGPSGRSRKAPKDAIDHFVDTLLASYSSNRVIAATHSLFREDYLPQLDISSPESAGAREEVILPHFVETIGIVGFDLGPVFVKIFKPGDERSVVIGAHVVPIFHDK